MSRKSWTKEEIKFLKKEYLNFNNSVIAKKLSRSPRSICFKCWELGLSQGAKDLVKIKLRRTEAAYLAGFIDGEGCIRFSISPKTGTPRKVVPVIEVSNADKEVLDWIFSITKVGNRWRTRPVYSSPELRYITVRPHFHFSLSGRWRVKALLEIVLPYLRIRKQTAKIMLEYLKTHKHGLPTSNEWKLILECMKSIKSMKPNHLHVINRLRLKCSSF